jgi:hypothetical protein
MVLPEEVVYSSDIVKDPHIISHDNREIRTCRKSRAEILTVPLHGHGYGGRVESIGTVAYTPSSTTGPKWQHLPEGVEKQVEIVLR